MSDEASKTYWEKRQEQKYLAGEVKINQYYKDLEKSFEQAKKEIQSVINDFYMRYSVENEISYSLAQKMLNNAEIGELQDFIDLVNENMNKYNQQVNNMSIKARITRYQGLENQIDAILQQLYAVEYEYKGHELLKDIYSDAYYRTWYNIDVYNGFHAEFAQVNPVLVEGLINYPFNGADYSTRLWKQKDYMLQALNESLTTMLIQGKNPNTLSKEFAKKFGSKEFEAYRLLHTEGSFIIEQATQKAYEEDGVEKYQWLATLDSRTCEECQPLDGKVFDVGKGVVGQTLTPKHMLCRCTTTPYYDDELIGTRIARDPITGKNYEVPGNMTYQQWHKEHIESNLDAILAEKKIKNLKTDKKQHDKYKDIFGKDIPKSLDDFQNLKYNNSKEWQRIKELKQQKLNEMDFPTMKRLVGKLGDKEVRLWYKKHDEDIPKLLDNTKTLKEQAIHAHQLRNKYRTQARELMRDQVKRIELDNKKPNFSFEQLMDYKKQKYLLTDEEAYADIIRSSQTTNKKYDELAGVKEDE